MNRTGYQNRDGRYSVNANNLIVENIMMNNVRNNIEYQMIVIKNFKKGEQGSKVKKLWKQVRDQKQVREWKQVKDRWMTLLQTFL